MNSSEGVNDLRASLVGAALAMLEADGGEPSLRAVARAAGVSAMAPYRHFADKADLLAAVAEHGFRRLAVALAAADREDDPHAALFAQGMAFVGFARAHPALYRLMYGEHYGSAAVDSVQATYRILAERVAGIVPDQAETATLACRALVQGLASLALAGRIAPTGGDPVAGALLLFINGLAGGG